LVCEDNRLGTCSNLLRILMKSEHTPPEHHNQREHPKPVDDTDLQVLNEKRETGLLKNQIIDFRSFKVLMQLRQMGL
jgi:hypothetical protein